MQRVGFGLLSLVVVQMGCVGGAAHSPAAVVDDPVQPAAGVTAPATGAAADGAAGATAGSDVTPLPPRGPIETDGPGAAPVEMLPTDTRPAVIADTPPPVVSGGTLLVARDGVTAVAADPDRDRVSLIDLASKRVSAQVALEPGDEPGRLAEDADGRVYVVLRRAGAVATLDLPTAAVIDRRAVCAAPRGIAYDAGADALQVACMSGELVTLPAGAGDPTRSVRVATDLRDVVVQGGHLFVSRFKSASLLELDGDGSVAAQHTPSDVRQTLAIGAELFNGPTLHGFAPALARRTLAIGNGSILMLHEREMTDEVNIDPHDPASMGQLGGGNAYGNGDNCQSIVQSALSVMDADGTMRQSASIAGSVLAVDAAVSLGGNTLAIASAGTHDFNTPTPPFGAGPVPPLATLPLGAGAASFDASVPFGIVTVLDMADAGVLHSADAPPDSDIGCAAGAQVSVPGQPIAVAYAPDGALVIQSREPANVSIFTSAGLETIDLGGDSRFDTGHDLFHRDAGAGIACASCHGEGGDDGHVWNFSSIGPRRTQAVYVGLGGTEPFHWSGDMDGLPMLVDQVLVGRMGGVPQSPERVDALSHWLFQLQPPARIRAADDAAALRGKALFESDSTGCAECHGGEKLSNNQSVDVGTGGAFQVPVLVGVGYRAPFVHTGCAASLRDRFDPACGGDRHGHTADLGADQIDDLIAYLESL